MPRQTALVVEDSPEFTRLATSLLTTEGFRVVHAGTGTEGVEAARRHAPELVILDVTLPGPRRDRGLPPDPRVLGLLRHHGHGPHRRARPGPGPDDGRRRLRHQALLAA